MRNILVVLFFLAAVHAAAQDTVRGTVRTIDAVGIRVGNEIQWRFWRLE